MLVASEVVLTVDSLENQEMRALANILIVWKLEMQSDGGVEVVK